MILFFTYVVAALILGLYIWWFVVRYRRDKRKEEAAAPPPLPPMPSARLQPPVARPEPLDVPPAVVPPAPGVTPAAPASQPVLPPSTTGPARTVAEALAGISLPNDLTPLTTMAPRIGSGDRVAFWTKAPADVVGPAFADELERLGYSVSPLDERSLAASRGDDRLMVYIHPDGAAAEIDGQKAFGSVPEGAVVIETLIPF
jgi:hypothetical protein